METRIIKKQEAPFHLRSPDEPEARAAYEAEHPAESENRRRLSTADASLFETDAPGSTS